MAGDSYPSAEAGTRKWQHRRPGEGCKPLDLIAETMITGGAHRQQFDAPHTTRARDFVKENGVGWG
jgi:hypothetical protein